MFLNLSQAAAEWSELKGEHFLVYYQPDYQDFAKEVSLQSEKYYDSIARDLGYVRFSNFWKWNNRVKIYIYPDHESFIQGTGQNAWSHGVADYQKKMIVSYAWGRGFLDLLLPHEMAHLIFRDFVGFTGQIPLWLDEGVAQWEEEKIRNQRKKMVKQLAQNSLLLSLDELMQLDVRKINGQEKIKIYSINKDNFQKQLLELEGNTLVDVFYLQAFSLIGFLIEEYSAENFLIFCRQLRDGKTINDALKFSYPVQMRTTAELEKKWCEYVFN